MKTFAKKLCENCDKSYIPTGPASKFCAKCSTLKKQESRERDKAKRRSGIGSGNSPRNRGKTHPNYKTGIGMYKKIRDRKFIEQGYRCNRCEKQATSDQYNPYEWCGHHIDHNRLNNHPSNIEVICKRCHQIEHECWKAFEGATTIPKGSRNKCSEAPSLPKGSEDIV